jgi:hypothetical protein
MTSRAAMIAAILSTLAATLSAQETEAPPLALPIGVKVRLATTRVPELVDGILVRTDSRSATFLMERGTEQKVLVEDIRRLDVSFSQKRHTLTGALIGIALGVGMAFAFDVDPDNCGFDSPDFCSRGEAVAAGVLTFGLIGTGVGALVRSDRWTTVNLENLKGSAPAIPRVARLKPAVSFTVRF